jgi:hypothetical protein
LGSPAFLLPPIIADAENRVNIGNGEPKPGISGSRRHLHIPHRDPEVCQRRFTQMRLFLQYIAKIGRDKTSPRSLRKFLLVGLSQGIFASSRRLKFLLHVSIVAVCPEKQTDLRKKFVKSCRKMQEDQRKFLLPNFSQHCDAERM